MGTDRLRPLPARKPEPGVLVTDRALPRRYAPLPPLAPVPSSRGRAVASSPSADPLSAPQPPSLPPHPGPLAAPLTWASPDPHPSAPATPRAPPFPLTHPAPRDRDPGPPPPPPLPRPDPLPPGRGTLQSPPRDSPVVPPPPTADCEPWPKLQGCGGASAERTGRDCAGEGRQRPACPGLALEGSQNTEPEAEKPPDPAAAGAPPQFAVSRVSTSERRWCLFGQKYFLILRSSSVFLFVLPFPSYFVRPLF